MAALCWSSIAAGQTATPHYFGFDRNDYPGDALLPQLRRSFSYTGYWLNNPPGENSNNWTGKRAILKAHGFGFMILFNGRLDAELKGKDATALGRADAAAAISAARKEGFPPEAILFLDQEEGGRLTPEQSAYLFSWVNAVRSSPYRPGVYCSGILAPDGSGKISTAQDIESHDSKLTLWVVNDQCPPSPGCVIPRKPIAASESGTAKAEVWQYTRSPRTEFARQCGSSYAADNNCYVPGLPHESQTFVDLNVSPTRDPSHGR
jgi:hypothetical protein